jgi:pimeloyl-ACP methyl ester carboxylesterase
MVDLGEGRSVRVLEEGSGRPIVLVHGWPTNANAWGRQLTGLPGHRVLAVDLPGFGLSPPADEPTVAALATAVRDLLAADGIDDALLVGWSLGGLVVLDYCRQFGGERLRGIGIVDVSPRLMPGEDWPHGEGTPFTADGLGAWEERFRTDPQAVVEDVYTIGLADVERHAREREWLVAESLKANRETAMPILVDAFHQDYRDVLHSVPVPALVLYGAHSTSTTPWLHGYVPTRLKEPTFLVFDESSHCLMLEETDRFNQELDAFARRV